MPDPEGRDLRPGKARVSRTEVSGYAPDRVRPASTGFPVMRPAPRRPRPAGRSP
ncbi:MAG: hypothetical protein M0C28_27105 [Candidatus Moduliflexus flocculans]|nr:hypothetical protein [Candidatus Moduliflexus flocculans]